MERREAPAFLATGTRQDGRLVRHSVLHPLGFMRGKKLVPAKAGRMTAYPAPPRIRAKTLARFTLPLQGRVRRTGCLKFESAMT